jgi:hypothetical protein
MTDEFKTRLISHSRLVVDRAPRATSEAATQQYLILPFFQLLGYDPLNPDEIIPEDHASFSDKFKNRVDYSICTEGKPAIAVECKCAGRLVDANRGELKGYFNALSTVKLGILTDGLVYQLFSDTDRENMMDDEPFITIDLSEVAANGINDNALDALNRLRKGTFDPANVGADARKKIYTASYIAALEANFRSPAEPMVKALMDLAGIDGRRTARLVEEHAPIVSEALEMFLDKKILERVGFADRDVVKMAPVSTSPNAATPGSNGDEVHEPVLVQESDDGIVTTETELSVYDYVRNRLAFLVKDDALFEKLKDVAFVDRKTVFTVFYKQERKGRLFNFREGSNPTYRFEFAEGEPLATDDLRTIDSQLVESFQKRVAELG